MSNDQIPEKPETSTGPIGGGLKRRDLLLSGSSLVAASALSAVGLTSPAQAQQPAPAPRRAAAEHRRHHGRRHRHLEYRRLPPRHDGRADAEPRQARRRGHAVHRLLRRGELHGGPRQLHHRRTADPHRHDHGRPGRRAHRHAGGGGDDRHRAQRHGLRHRPVRQEPPRRQERVSADGARLRRILRLPLSPRRDGRPGAPRAIRRSC